MTYTLVRNETIHERFARGLAFDVVDADTLDSIGVVVDGATGWRVHTAGTGIPVDQAKIHERAADAIGTVLAAREAASQPGGMLHVVDGLTGFQRAVIDFAGQRYRYIGTREVEIRRIFDMSATRYTQHMLNLIDNPHAERYNPALIRHLRAKRDRDRAARSLKTAGVTA